MKQKNNREKLSSKKKILLILIAIITFAIIIGLTYALVFTTLTGTKKYTILSEDLKLFLDETKTITDVVEGTKVIPVTDKEGKQTEGYYFSIVNDGTHPIKYSIYLDEDERNTMPIYALRYNLIEKTLNLDVTENLEDTGEVGNRLLTTQTINANTTHEYTLKVWLGVQAGNDAKNKTYSANIRVDVSQIIDYYELILNGTDPVLTDNLVPVTIADNGEVTKANLEEEWYNYEQQRWANAVVLVNDSYEYDTGDIIPESNIESYFVWIPRYRYKIFNEGNYTGITELNASAPQTIEIEFENKYVKKSTGSALNSWLTHPAFTAFDSNGFWVGKFESGYNGATSSASADVDTSDASKLIIKPNVYSWRGITIGNAFKTAYDYMREEDSHMMKNTEWGAVAYLQHSIYGSRSSVRVNNNSSSITGYAATVEPTLGHAETSIEGNIIEFTALNANGINTKMYNTSIGYTASTTNNISGIYDMSGGAWEYVMGYNEKSSTIGGSSGLTTIYGDFFTSAVWEKYYDKYKSTSETLYSNRILGDATGEMGPFGIGIGADENPRYRTSWYDDFAFMTEETEAWFRRGGFFSNGIETGVFAFNNTYGENSGVHSFRVVLTP